MKHSVFLKATIVATVLIANTVPLFASEAANETMTKSKPTVGEKLDDAAITTKVKMALLLHNSTSAIRTEVTTTNGVVAISGTAQNSAEKDLVTKLVEDVQGVQSVHNEMKIAKSDAPTVGEKLDDSAVTAKVKMALVLHRSTGALRTSVTTNGGVVTVSGKARNDAEKELVNKVVEDIDGVKRVVNTMTIEK
ncbi:MAG: BON domain-containing protein [Helicobacteraceae bacterium]|jgi:hyperosmotically inducible protein|nr:BON domain-containing protein [Helicobacteraceae bacterium]